MANAPRAKGTRWEVELLDLLRGTFGAGVHRAPLRGVHDAGDYVGTPVLVEAKSTKTTKFLEWARVATHALSFHHEATAWVIAWHGDRRRGEGPYALMPLTYWLELEERARREA